MSYQPTLFDVVESRARRDAGIKVAIDHADNVTENWSTKAYNILLEYLRDVPGEFMIEDVRAFSATKDDFEMPPNNKAWGGVIVRAYKSGLVKRVRYDQVKNVKAHRTTVSVWIKTE